MADDGIILGNRVTLTATFTDPTSGDAVDPDAVTYAVLDPDDKLMASGSATKASTGVYNATCTPARPGLHRVRFKGSGTHQGAQEGSFTVQPSRFYELGVA